ncbi:MAG: choice-of-anchor Q domain-containing protein [Wenzhouxiangella sp.]|nr:choice-of-anchor Q domain-containing protein [Wenzhouxiangella sp.]
MHNLIITGGSIDGAGGGILNNQGFMVLTSVDVSSNSASAGGGIYNDNGGLRIVDSQVQLNTASVIGGGGVFNTGVAGQVEVDGSLIRANIGPEGGGIFSNDGVVVIESQSALNLNEASASNGGAVSNSESAELIVRESSFQGNFALVDGGAIYSDSSVPTLVSDAIFVDNEASSGGAIRAVGAAVLDVERGRFESNSAIDDGGAISATFVELRQSHLEGNESVTGNGGAVRASTGGKLMDGSVVRENSAVNGGGLHGQVLEVTDSRVENNSATGDGGGVYISNRALIETSRIRANSAAVGGGIYLRKLSIFESEFRRLLISENTVSEQGGGIWLGSDAVIGNTTITLNAAAAGGGIYVETDANARAINMSLIGHLSGQDLHKYGTLTLHNSIISTPGQPDCLMGPDHPTITSLGHNIADDESCFGLDQPTDSVGTNPLLLPLGNAGGNTLTYTPAADSPAVDAGENTACNDDPVFGVDQRGALRPAGESCDIGSHERGGVIPENPLFSDRFEQ